jgi:methylenetetrahydrofolate reductase (NADPH)
MPVVAGIPGVTSPQTLLRYGVACGVGASLGVLRKQTGLLRLATRRVWTPSELVGELAEASVEAQTELSGIHVFPFGAVDRTARWLADHRAADPGSP